MLLTESRLSLVNFFLFPSSVFVFVLGFTSLYSTFYYNLLQSLAVWAFVSPDENEKKLKDGVEFIHPEVSRKEFLKPVPSSSNNKQVDIFKRKDGQNVNQDATPAEIDAPVEVNMEASILADDVIRAGGFGARDDISSFLPVASDSTDFEAMIRVAREYEEPQGKICRPGLGWTETTEAK